jgi:hypothetical protein
MASLFCGDAPLESEDQSGTVKLYNGVFRNGFLVRT